MLYVPYPFFILQFVQLFAILLCIICSSSACYADTCSECMEMRSFTFTMFMFIIHNVPTSCSILSLFIVAPFFIWNNQLLCLFKSGD